MGNSTATFKFSVGGPVQVNYGTYLSRPADKELLEACKAGKFAYVLASPETGKSSLMYETAKKLSQEKIRTAIIDLTRIGRDIVDADHWYFNFADELASTLDIDFDIEAWWAKKSRTRLSRRFRQFLHDVLLKNIDVPVVIFVDEIDLTLDFDFTDEFFAAINTIYLDRVQREIYCKLTFVMLGVATSNELMQDTKHSPFDQGQAIFLEDFSKEICEPICSIIKDKYPDQGQNYFDQIYDLTNGHPHLTQKLCSELLSGIWEKPPTVEDLVAKIAMDGSINRLEKKVRADKQHAEEMSMIYKKVGYDGISTSDNHSYPTNKLKLYGLITAKNDQLIVRNKLYAQVLDWVRLLPHKVRYNLTIVAIRDMVRVDTGSERQLGIIGTGFLVSFHNITYVVTCRHVIKEKEIADEVNLFHFRSRELIAKVRLLPVFITKESKSTSATQDHKLAAQSDVCILEVTSSLPSDLRPFSFDDFQDHINDTKCWCFGYVEQKKEKGSWIEDLICEESVSGEFIRISQPNESKIKVKRGASGAPLANDEGKIIGMIHARTDNEAYFIPSRIIKQTLLSLQK